jgi:hypothetical protein
VQQLATLAGWPARRWWVALVGAVVVALLVGAPTDVIPNPVFGRQVGVTWWSYPTLAVTAVLAGLLIATYVDTDRPRSEGGAAAGDADGVPLDRDGKRGGIGGLLSFFAVGCPTCNKLAVIALGSTGALDWFAPAQPLLAVGSVALLAWALRGRLAPTCRIDPGRAPSANMGT